MLEGQKCLIIGSGISGIGAAQLLSHFDAEITLYDSNEKLDPAEMAKKLPEGVEAIPAHAFVNCESLGEVSVPSSVTLIGAHSFIGCPAATNLVFAGPLPRIHPEAFRKRAR